MVLSPLTGERQIELLEKIKVDDLAVAWLESFKIDVSHELTGFNTIGFYRCLKSKLRFFYPARVGSDTFYEALQARLPWYYLEEKPEYEFARNFISVKDEVLEVGCGRGEFAKKISARSYLGLELSRRAQEMAAVDGIQVVVQPAEDHCIEREQCYDVVCAFQVLEHVAEPATFIKACLRCLKAGGLLVYSVPNADSYLAYCTNVVLGMPPHHLTWWVEASFRYIASVFGLEIVAVECERLAEMHVRSYAIVLAREALIHYFDAGRQRRLIDHSFYFKILNKLAFYLSRPIAEVLLKDPRLRPAGHSITVVLRKPLRS
jgi:2-polyprenyl-3-methyl-5-hydroxy-6-metoxy-1,4-benzoquinol methylase